jgi:16S rRNA (adenine1518-N6/adenine1519-N6)-dimethyltransferase
VGAAFEQRRKMLRGALRGIVTPQVFEAAGIDSTRRGETLSVAQFVALADAAAAT